MGLALKEFVDKDEKDALVEIVKLQLRDTQKVLSTRNIRDEDIVQEVINETERSRVEQLSPEEVAKTRKVAIYSLNETNSPFLYTGCLEKNIPSILLENL